MTTTQFREDRARCSALSRIMSMPTFQAAVAAVFEDLSLTEAHLLNHNLDATATMELRLTNQRKGHSDFLNALKMMCEPIADAPPELIAGYGATEEQAKLANDIHGWETVE